MNRAPSHIVQQFQLTLEVDEEARRDYSLLLEELSRLGNEVLPPLLEKALGEAFPDDTYQRVERLELEIEVDSLEEISSVFQKELPRQLQQVLARQSMSAAGGGKESALVAGEGPGQWLYTFLRFGSLPSSAPRQLSLTQLAALSQAWLADQARWRQRFYELLLAQPQALLRLLRHFGASWLWHCLQHERPTGKPAQAFEHWRRVRQYAKVEQAGQTAVLQFWQAELGEVIPSQKQIRPRAATEKTATASLVAEQEEEQSGTTALHYLEDAGLVLVHPFIPGLLEALHLATKEKVNNPAQAASVLYSLAWGQSPEAEWQLVLPKLFLGIPLEQLVEVCEVSPAELAAGEEMLTAAIAHWSVLGNTSVAGFRDSFLQRPGRLERTEEGWSLQLEQRPYDILLEQLPWQLSFIKLPWMEQLIRTAL